MVSHLGWVTALYIAAIHLIFKGMLFLASAGVIHRTGTRRLHELGGLIKRMPITYISVLMAIIALSGVPPLAGFGGKVAPLHLPHRARWYLQAGVAFFASTVAFLYLFKLIYAVFSGSSRTISGRSESSSDILLLPQGVLIIVLMTVSMFPNTMLAPLMSAVDPILPATAAWTGTRLSRPSVTGTVTP